MSDDKTPAPKGPDAPQKPDAAARATGPVAVAQEPKKIAALSPDRLAQYESTVAEYRVYVPAGLEPKDLLTVAFWTHFGGLFQAAKKSGEVIIHAFAEDRKWVARYWVLDAGINWAKVAMLDSCEVEPVALGARIMLLPGYTVENGGIFAKWRIVRDADRKVIRDRFETEGDAYGWLADFAKSLAA